MTPQPPHDKLTVGSLFAGIGGFDLGLERAGFEIKWHSEIEPYCNAVLKKHWPEVPNYGDITKIRKPEYVDLLCGGFPCQDLSVAGKGAGIEGSRSGLWSEFARIIRKVRPRYVIVENVAALRYKGKGLYRVLADLAESGYDAEWDCIPASAVGAPHKRDRIWIIAYPSNPSEVGNPDGEGLQGYRRPVEASDQGNAAATGRGSRAFGVGNSERFRLQRSKLFQEWNNKQSWTGDDSWWATEPNVGRVAHGIPARVDRIRSLGNALVPQIAEFLGRKILAWEESQKA